MRVMVILEATRNSEAGILPSEALLTAMGDYNQALADAGILQSGEGLKPSAHGRRVAISATGRSVTDGPFAGSASLVAGFWIWQVGSMDDATDWALRCPEPMPGEDTTLELRPLFEVEDFGDAMTPELRSDEERLRAQLAADAADGGARPSVRTCLWFDGDAAEAATFYASLLPGSHVQTDLGTGAGGPPAMVELSLAGTPYLFLNGGPTYKLSPAASIVVGTSDQAQTDRLWAALVDGGQEGRCGWLVDRFGVSWQVVPDALPRLLGATDREAAGRAVAAMLQMGKLDIAELEAAFRGEGGT